MCRTPPPPPPQANILAPLSIFLDACESEDTGHRDEMLSQTPRHLVQRPSYFLIGDVNHITNEEVRKQIQQSVGPFNDPLTMCSE